MNAAELKCCTACRRSYIVYAPLDYIDSGLCTPCEDGWFEKNVGADGGLFAEKVLQPDQWSAFLGLMGAFVFSAFAWWGIVSAARYLWRLL